MRRGAFDFYTAEYAADQSVPPGTLADKGLMKRACPPDLTDLARAERSLLQLCRA